MNDFKVSLRLNSECIFGGLIAFGIIKYDQLVRKGSDGNTLNEDGFDVFFDGKVLKEIESI